MTENSEQKVEEKTQTFAGAPGLPGGSGTTPNYMQEYPTETNPSSTTYDRKNAIWDSGTTVNGYKNVSFAGSETGLQFKANTIGHSGPIGAPGNPDSTNVYVRVKRAARPYDPWYEVFHKGNFDPSKYAIKALVDKKADTTYVNSNLASKVENVYFEECINNVNRSIAAKADKTYVDSNVAEKADISWMNDRLNEKSDIDPFVKQSDTTVSQLKSFMKEIDSIYTKLNNIK